MKNSITSWIDLWWYLLFSFIINNYIKIITYIKTFMFQSVILTGQKFLSCVLSCSRFFCSVLSHRTRQNEIWLFWEIFLKHARCYTCCLLVSLQKYYYKYRRKNAVLLCTSNNSNILINFQKKSCRTGYYVLSC